MKNNIATTCMIQFLQMGLSHGEVGWIFAFYEQKPKDN